MKQWKKYVGYDQWDQSFMGQESASPGPMDNSNLFRGKYHWHGQNSLASVQKVLRP